MAAADKWACNRGKIVLSIPVASKCCFGAACVKPPQSSSGHSGSARSDPNQSRQPPPPLRTNQKAPNEPDAGTRCNITTHTRRHSVQCHPTHNAVTRCMQIHYLSAQAVSGRRRSLASPQRNGISAPKFELLKIQRHSRNFIKFSSFLRRFRATQSKTKATRKKYPQIS